MLEMKTTSNARIPQNIKRLNISATTDRIFLKIETQVWGTKEKYQLLEMKTTSIGRRPQNIKS
jgi:hypothetical protein